MRARVSTCGEIDRSIAEKGRDCIHAMLDVRKDCDADLEAAFSDACAGVFVCPAGAPRMGIVPRGGAVIERVLSDDGDDDE